MNAGTRWIAGVIATLVAGVVSMVVLIVFAERATAGRIAVDYYQRAAHYDHDIAEADASRALGWQATVTLAADGARVCVRDRSGAALVVAVELTAAHRAHPGAPAVGAASTAADGCVAIAVPLAPGVHDLRLVATVGADRFVATAAREVR